MSNSIFFVKKDTPAWKLLVRNIPLRPGHIIPCTQEELDSVRMDIEVLTYADVVPQPMIKEGG